MKRIAMTLVILCITGTLALAQQSGTFRDSHGNTIGTWQDQGNERIYRDRDGNQSGSRTDYGSQRDYRDRSGNYVGSDNRDRE